MPETTSEFSEQPSEVILDVFKRLKQLHQESEGEMTDVDRVNTEMSNQIIGDTTLMALQALMRQETKELEERKNEEGWDNVWLEQEIFAMKQRITAALFKEHWYESTLSTSKYPIHSMTYGETMFRLDLRMLMTQKPSPERLQEFAWLRFDVNGLRGFKDCTSHHHTTLFLQEIARIFVDPEGPTRQYLEQLGIHAIPMATGGDEFDLYLRDNTPLSPKLLDWVIASFQKEISSSEKLRSFLRFDDENILIQYGMTADERRSFAKISPGEERQRRLAAIRQDLPNGEWEPSVAGGRSSLDDGIRYAVDKDKDDLRGPETFITLRDKVAWGTIDRARDEQDANKKKDLDALAITNPQLYRFRLHTRESRKLARWQQTLQETVAALEEENNHLTDRTREQAELIATLEREREEIRSQLRALLEEKSPEISLRS